MNAWLRRLAAWAVAAVFAAAGPASAALQELRVANYNVENLFDDKVNSRVNPLSGEPADAEWSAESWRRWTPARYRTKLAKIAWVVDRMKPDILVVEEVENAAVCRDLADEIARTYHWEIPYLAHHESRDPRGIDVAVLSRYPVRKVSYKSHVGRRGLLTAEIDVDGTTVTVFANHWKSQVGDARQNIRVRTEEAALLRSAMLSRLSRDPDAVVIALGDFNENVDGPAVTAGLKPAADRDAALASLREGPEGLLPYNLVCDIPEEGRGSFYYARRKVWNTFDGIVVQPRMLLPRAEPGPAWRAGGPSETVTFALPEMRWGSDGRPNAFHRMRKYEPGSGGDKVSDEGAYNDGFSDHFPVLTVLHRARE